MISRNSNWKIIVSRKVEPGKWETQQRINKTVKNFLCKKRIDTLCRVGYN